MQDSMPCDPQGRWAVVLVGEPEAWVRALAENAPAVDVWSEPGLFGGWAEGVGVFERVGEGKASLVAWTVSEDDAAALVLARAEIRARAAVGDLPPPRARVGAKDDAEAEAASVVH